MAKRFLTIALFATICGFMFAQKPTLLRNAFSFKASYPKLWAEKAVVHDPTEWTYVHHPSMTWFKGKLYVVFSNGKAGEDECGQRVMLTSSSDFTEWSTPEILVEPAVGKYGQTMISTPGGITVIDGKMIVYYTLNDNDGTTNTRYNPELYAVWSEDGETWSEPVYMGIHVFPCQRPLQLSNGRIVLSSNSLVYCTDDATGLGGWHRGRMDVMKFQDDVVTVNDIKPQLCEGTLFELNDGTVLCAFRSTGKTYDGYLWQTQSNDGGMSWTSPVKTNFTDNNTKSSFGALPDGRYYYVGTPDAKHPGTRYPLVLAVSNDGYNFDKTYILSDDKYSQQYKGRWKGGDYGYPFAYVHDGYIYVVVSRHKERLEIIRVLIEEIN